MRAIGRHRCTFNIVILPSVASSYFSLLDLVGTLAKAEREALCPRRYWETFLVHSPLDVRTIPVQSPPAGTGG